jgi:hypothetical protein
MVDMSEQPTTTFQVGQSYQCRSLGDYDCVWTFRVTKRSAQFVTLQGDGETRRAKVRNYRGVEVCSPLGTYSLSPTLSASKRL